ncbi:hypothetical protein BDW59DRAFT_102476 [Aspergillus cavernicola]|uniref:Uncharacterized protein n=1 Tax=Aspergillus cavernicola TaxID=176166 RepID=A0ABR4I3H1_9EURO
MISDLDSLGVTISGFSGLLLHLTLFSFSNLLGPTDGSLSKSRGRPPPRISILLEITRPRLSQSAVQNLHQHCPIATLLAFSPSLSHLPSRSSARSIVTTLLLLIQSLLVAAGFFRHALQLRSALPPESPSALTIISENQKKKIKKRSSRFTAT